MDVMEKTNSSNRWLLVTAIFAVAIAMLVFVARRGETPASAGLSPRQERAAGVSGDDYDRISALRTRFAAGGLKEADWTELGNVLDRRTPVGMTLGLSALGKLGPKEDRRRALALIERFAQRSPANEPLHTMVGEALLHYVDTGGKDDVRAFVTSASDPRLREAGKEALGEGGGNAG